MNDMIKLIQQTRLQKGYNFFDIEQATGIPTKKMHSFEKGLTQLSLDELDKLFVYLGIQQQSKEIKKNQPKRPKNLLLYTGIATLIFVAVLLIFLWPMFSTDPNSSEPSNGTSAIGLENEQNSTPDTNEEAPSNSPEEALTTESNVSEVKESTVPSVVEPDKAQGVTLRFWGNMPYQSQIAPTLGDSKESSIFEIFTIEGLIKRDNLPSWLTTKDKEHMLLNLATRFVWEEVVNDEFVVVKERDRLNKLGFKNMGLDYKETSTIPYIMETTEGKIGILPFTRHILDAEHLAENNEIGLARVPDQKTTSSIIQEAKKDVDLLIVMVGWGERDSTSPDKKQTDLAKAMVAAGADIIIGNHSAFAQEIDQIEQVPVFYNLGHAISSKSPANAYSFVLDIDIADRKLSRSVVHVGKLLDGKITFDVSAEEKKVVENKMLTSQVQGQIEIK